MIAAAQLLSRKALAGTHEMGSFRPQLRAFGTAGLCTFALFAIAAWIPNDAIGLIAWLIAVFLGLPVSILTRVYAVRSAVPTGRFGPAAFTFLLRAFGALSLLLGVGILAWQAYLFFVRPLPEFTGLTAAAQTLLTVLLLGLGYRLLKRSLSAEHIITALPDGEL